MAPAQRAGAALAARLRRARARALQCPGGAFSHVGGRGQYPTCLANQSGTVFSLLAAASETALAKAARGAGAQEPAAGSPGAGSGVADRREQAELIEQALAQQLGTYLRARKRNLKDGH